MRCPYCEAENPHNAEKCDYCGSDIKKESEKTTTVINQNIYVNNNENKSAYIPPTYNNTVEQKRLNLKLLSFGIAVFCWLLLIIVLLLSHCSSSYETKETKNSSVWATDYTDINEFNYYVDGNEIYVKRYEGKEKKIKINSTYEIDGKTRYVVSFIDATFLCHKSESIVIPEGTKTLKSNIFNSCGVKFVFLPSTLEKPDDKFWGYFHDVEKIYYGGTEEQWNIICTVDRFDVDAKEIVFETDVSELK